MSTAPLPVARTGARELALDPIDAGGQLLVHFGCHGLDGYDVVGDVADVRVLEEGHPGLRRDRGGVPADRGDVDVPHPPAVLAAVPGGGLKGHGVVAQHHDHPLLGSLGRRRGGEPRSGADDEAD
jgi:hypothetical protein